MKWALHRNASLPLHHNFTVSIFRFSHLCIILRKNIAILSFIYLLLSNLPTPLHCFLTSLPSFLWQGGKKERKERMPLSFSKTNSFICDLDCFPSYLPYISFLHSCLCFTILISPFPLDNFHKTTDVIY